MDASYRTILSLLSLGAALFIGNPDVTTAESLLLDYHSEPLSDDDKLEKTKKKKHGFSGILYVKDALKESNPSVGGSIKWKPNPKDYFYFKLGGKYNYDNDDEDGFTYSWGLGYDDWHTGTWTVQLNHWGDIKLGDGVDLDNAFLSVGYKIKSDFLKENNLQSTVSLTRQIKGEPKFSTSLNWKPHSYWFIKGIVIVPLDGDDKVKWNYVFGYDDWHPDTFGIEYSNYDSNELFETNFRKSGKITLSYKWEF